MNASNPTAHTSAGGPTTPSASVCSGAIHAGVPMTAVAPSCASATTFAMPKSSSLMTYGEPAVREAAR